MLLENMWGNTIFRNNIKFWSYLCFTIKKMYLKKKRKKLWSKTELNFKKNYLFSKMKSLNLVL